MLTILFQLFDEGFYSLFTPFLFLFGLKFSLTPPKQPFHCKRFYSENILWSQVFIIHHQEITQYL